MIVRCVGGLFLIFLSADLSQVESRIALAFTGDPEMLRLANMKPYEYDQHTRNAALIFSCSEAEVTKDQRYLGKKAVHAAQRGARGKKLSEELLKDGYFMTEDQCDGFIMTYLAHHQPLQKFFRDVRTEILEYRALTNTWGRFITYDYAILSDDLYREGYSWRLQSEASDLLLQWGLIPIYAYTQMMARRPRMHVPVHDSLLLSCHPADAYYLADLIRLHIERPRIYYNSELTVPVEFELGSSWAAKHSFKKLPSEKEFTEAAYDCEGGNDEK